ncbi:MAG: PH domain-containing protein [Tepidisphaeraceae bacterium]
MTESPGDMPPQDASSEGRPHKPADDREEVYFQGSPLMRGELGRVFACTALGLGFIALPIVLRIVWKRWLPWWAVLALIVVGAVVLSIPVILTKLIRYRISNYRIDYERGLLAKNIDTLELWHVEDINFHQSLSDRLLGVGTITVISKDDTTPRLELKSLPNPRPLFETLKQRVIAVKRQRGVIKMDIG